MSFSDQVRWCRKWGAVLLLLGFLTFGILYLLHTNGRNDLALYWADFCNAIIGLAAFLLLFGGLMRPLQKKMYHRIFEASEHYRSRLAANPVIRWLCWLDAEGRDRDA
jgi:hypothetical protein